MTTETRVLVVAAHPDDEVIGCGGTLSKLFSAGAAIAIFWATPGVIIRDAESEAKAVRRQEHAARVAKILGAEVFLLNYRDQELAKNHRLAGAVEDAIDHYRPGVLYTHCLGELNSDHDAVTWAALVAASPVRAHAVPRVYGFHVDPSTVHQGALLHDERHEVLTGEHLLRKQVMMACYEDEVKQEPHPRSAAGMRDLARVAGARVGVEFAESFRVYWEIAR